MKLSEFVPNPDYYVIERIEFGIAWRGRVLKAYASGGLVEIGAEVFYMAPGDPLIQFEDMTERWDTIHFKHIVGVVRMGNCECGHERHYLRQCSECPCERLA